MKDYFRPNISRMAGYTPGLQPREEGWVKLNTNENPYPCSPKVKEAILTEIETLRKYPDPLCEKFRDAASAVLGVKPRQILCGNGSDDILTIITRCFCGPDDALAYPYPTYSLYPVLAEIQGCRSFAVDFPEDFSIPRGLLECGAKLVILANPNSPTGTFIPIEDVDAFAAELDGVLVVDEAYADFAEDHAIRLVHTRENVIVSRSFSKSYSLAGLRFGYAVANGRLIEGLVKAKDSYNVDRLAIAAAAAAMKDQAGMRANAEKIKRTRTTLTMQLRLLGFSVRDSLSNFVLARCKSASEALRLYEELKRRKILVRYFNHRRVDDCLRISIGTDEEIETLLANVRDILA